MLRRCVTGKFLQTFIDTFIHKQKTIISLMT